MKQHLALLLLLVASACAQADDAAACKAAAGTYRTGVVTRGPMFVHGHLRKGVELSHTRLSLKADQDGRTYDVAIDNVFAAGFERQQQSVPRSLSAIKVNDRLELCGQLYTSGVGLHWVHNNCGATPTPAHPNGWIKKINANGTAGENMESNTAYCSLF
jgi:hypothetical protein